MASGNPQVAAGAVRAFFLYDIADSIDLARLRTVRGEGLVPAHLSLRPHTSPAYLQFPSPPLVAFLPPAHARTYSVSRRVKLFDYGVISVRLATEFCGPITQLVEVANAVRNSDAWAAAARATLDEVVDELRAVLDDPHDALIEDYFVARIERFAHPVSAEELLAASHEELSAIVLGESGPFSPGQREEALRHRFSYYADDLTILQWDAAVIYDRPESADAIEDILEFANSQLVELRTYDALLDRELDQIYAIKPERRVSAFLGRRAAEQAATLRYLIVDVLELTDRASNALKVIGDAYYARIYRVASVRLALDEWQRQVDRKLQSIGEMYRFFDDQARAGRDVLLEIVVIVLIVLEVVIGVLTLHH